MNLILQYFVFPLNWKSSTSLYLNIHFEWFRKRFSRIYNLKLFADTCWFWQPKLELLSLGRRKICWVVHLSFLLKNSGNYQSGWDCMFCVTVESWLNWTRVWVDTRYGFTSSKRTCSKSGMNWQRVEIMWLQNEDA